MTIIDRYASAIRTSNMDSRANPDETIIEDADVIGAAGFASKDHPLAMALTRLLSGDNHAADHIVTILADLAQGKARFLKLAVGRTIAVDMARAVLAWHRHGTCTACGGHGFELIPGAPAVSATQCSVCDGTRKMPFGREFPAPIRVVAFWLLAEVEREQSRAGPAAMDRLAKRMEF
jgi:hypothetical protein